MYGFKNDLINLRTTIDNLSDDLCMWKDRYEHLESDPLYISYTEGILADAKYTIEKLNSIIDAIH